MTSRLYIANSDNTGFIELTAFTGNKGTPFFDGDTSLVEIGMRCANGEASQGTFRLMDPDADLPSLGFNIPPHKVLLWTEDLDISGGDEIWLSKGRIATYDGGREGTFEVDDRVSFDAVVDDGNIELRGQAFTEEWVRPSETGVARVLALGAYTLNGASSTATHHRDTCEVTVSTSHLVPNTLTTTMPAKTYPPGTQPQDVIQDCADTENKIYSVVIHHDGGSHLCLLYIANDDHTTYASPIKISDHLEDWDPTDPTAPVYEPHWEMGKATLYDGQQLLTGVVSEWEGQFIFAEHAPTIDTYDYWVDSYSDANSESLAQAQQVVNGIINQRRLIRITHRVSIIMEASQVDLVAAGMSLEFRAAAMMGGTFLDDWLTRRVVECKFEPRIDGRYWAHLHLDRVPRRYPDFKGGVNHPPVCTGTTVEGGSEFLNFDWDTAPHEETIPAIGGLSQSAQVITGSTSASGPLMGLYRISFDAAPTGGPDAGDISGVDYTWWAVTPGTAYTFDLEYLTFSHLSAPEIGAVWIQWMNGAYGTWGHVSNDYVVLPRLGTLPVHTAFSLTAPVGATGVQFWQGRETGEDRGWHLHGIALSTGASVLECPEGSVSPSGHTHTELHTTHSVEELLTTETDDTLVLAPDGDGGVEWVTPTGGSGAPTTVNYLVGTADAGLSAEIVVGTTPGGELGGTWASPTVDATHSGSTHDAATNTHIADTTDAHDASAISIADAGSYFTSTEVEAALQELANGGVVGGPGSDWDWIVTLATQDDKTSTTPADTTFASPTLDANSFYDIEAFQINSADAGIGRPVWRWNSSQAIGFDGRAMHGTVHDLTTAGAADNPVGSIGAAGGGTQWPATNQSSQLPQRTDGTRQQVRHALSLLVRDRRYSPVLTYQLGVLTSGTARIEEGSYIRGRKLG